jgi:hypothetical protein
MLSGKITGHMEKEGQLKTISIVSSISLFHLSADCVRACVTRCKRSV